LIVHGEKDETCPIEHAHRMRAALTKAGRPPEWMQIANEGHGFYDVENRRAFYLKLEEFFGKHLGK
jgi:dipeptidyl aminopeptidase/acylaminoacyl peptidase